MQRRVIVGAVFKKDECDSDRFRKLRSGARTESQSRGAQVQEKNKGTGKEEKGEPEWM